MIASIFKKSAQKTTNRLISQGFISASESDMYYFGLEMGFSYIAGALVTVLIGLLFRRPFESVFFLVVFIPLRSFVGGFHTSTYARCFWVSAIAVTAVLWAVRLVESIYSPTPTIVITILAGTIMFLLAPVQDANRPLDEIEIRVHRRRARIVLCVELAALVISVAAGLSAEASVLACTFCLTSVSACVGSMKNHLHEKNRFKTIPPNST